MLKIKITLLLLLLLIIIPLHAPFHEHGGFIDENNCPFCQWENAFSSLAIFIFTIFFSHKILKILNITFTVNKLSPEKILSSTRAPPLSFI